MLPESCVKNHGLEISVAETLNSAIIEKGDTEFGGDHGENKPPAGR